MTKDEALKLALEALEELNNTNSYWWQEVDKQTIEKIEPAITAIKEALMSVPDGAQPSVSVEQEPVAYINVEQRKLEWAKYMTWDTPTVVNLPKIPLYTTPPQRKPLTRGQIREIEVDVSLNLSFDYITPAEQLCRAIEAAHGIKGEA